MPYRREWKESPLSQGADETIAYAVTVPTSWGTSAFSGITNALYEDPDNTNTDVSATKLSGSASASGQVITTKAVYGLTAGTKYRMEVKWTSSEGNTLEAFAFIYGQR